MIKIERITYDVSPQKMYDINGKDITPRRHAWIIVKTFLFRKSYVHFSDKEKLLKELDNFPWNHNEFNYTNKLGASEFTSKTVAERVVTLMKKHPHCFVTKEK